MNLRRKRSKYKAQKFRPPFQRRRIPKAEPLAECRGGASPVEGYKGGRKVDGREIFAECMRKAVCE